MLAPACPFLDDSWSDQSARKIYYRLESSEITANVTTRTCEITLFKYSSDLVRIGNGNITWNGTDFLGQMELKWDDFNQNSNYITKLKVRH